MGVFLFLLCEVQGLTRQSNRLFV